MEQGRSTVRRAEQRVASKGEQGHDGERRVEVQAYLRAHSLMNHTEVAKRMPEHKHELVYAPPYLPSAQPIKPLWA